MEKIKLHLEQFGKGLHDYRTLVLKEDEVQFCERISKRYQVNFSVDDVQALEMGKNGSTELLFICLDLMQILTSATMGMQNNAALYIASTKLPENIEEHIAQQMKNLKD